MNLMLSLYLVLLMAWQDAGTITGLLTVPAGMSRSDVTVELAGENRTVVSHTDGRYTFTGVPAGENTVIVSGGGFVPQVRTMDVAPGQTVVADFSLETVRSSINVVESLAEYLVPEVTSATKSPTRLLDAPQSIQVFPNQIVQSLKAMTSFVISAASISHRTARWFSGDSPSVKFSTTEREVTPSGASMATLPFPVSAPVRSV
jgi:hypothetical protein